MRRERLRRNAHVREGTPLERLEDDGVTGAGPEEVHVDEGGALVPRSTYNPSSNM
jgi:hypothetical protein